MRTDASNDQQSGHLTGITSTRPTTQTASLTRQIITEMAVAAGNNKRGSRRVVPVSFSYIYIVLTFIYNQTIRTSRHRERAMRVWVWLGTPHHITPCLTPTGWLTAMSRHETPLTAGSEGEELRAKVRDSSASRLVCFILLFIFLYFTNYMYRMVNNDDDERPLPPTSHGAGDGHRAVRRGTSLLHQHVRGLVSFFLLFLCILY